MKYNEKDCFSDSENIGNLAFGAIYNACEIDEVRLDK